MKRLKNIGFQLNFKIKQLEKGASPTYSRHIYYGTLYVNNVAVGRIGQIEAQNAGEVIKIVRNKIINLVDKNFKLKYKSWKN